MRLPVVLDHSGVQTVTTDQGYVVELSGARVLVQDFAFAIAGEAHTASVLERLWGYVVPHAHAHPGHYQGGDVTGELRGRFLLDWLPDAESVNMGKGLYQAHCAECHGEFASGGAVPGGGTAPAIAAHPSIDAIVREGKGEMPAFDFDATQIDALQDYLAQRLGEATLLVGQYHSVNFTFATATSEDGLETSDHLLQHTAVLHGRATKGETVVNFEVLITSPEGRQLVGAPFVSSIEKDTHESLGVRFNTKDPLEGDTLFDGVDFAALDYDGDGVLVLTEEGRGEAITTLDASAPLSDAGPSASVDAASSTDVVIEPTDQLGAAYDLLKRKFQTHDHFDIKVKQL